MIPNAIYYWILMLSPVGDAAGLPMAVFTDKAQCERQVEFYLKGDSIYPQKPKEMHWHCIGVIMPRSSSPPTGLVVQ